MKLLPIIAVLLLALLLPLMVCAQTTPRPIPVTRPATAPAPAAQPAPPTAPAVPAPPPPLATVNGSPVERAHLDKALEEEWAATLMRSLIADRLIRQEARRLGIKATADEVADRFSLERGKFASETAFQRHVRKQGLTSEGYLSHLTRELLLEKLLAQLTAVSEDEALAFYTSQKSEYAIPEKVHLHLIMTNTIEDAYLAGEKLAANEPFTDVARELSVHPSAGKGGDMGLVTDEAVPAAIAETIFALETGVTSKPLRAEDKYYLAQISARQPGQLVSFEQARPQILEQLAARKTLSREDYINLLARRAEIVVNWDPARYLTAEYGRLKQIQVLVDGEPLELEEPLVRLPNGNIIAAAKPLLQAIGARVHWQGSEQSMTATGTSQRVKVTVGSTQAVVGFDGKQALEMNFAPEIRSGVLFIAPRPVLTALGATVNWDAVRNTLVITSPPAGAALAPPSPPPAPGSGIPALPAGPADMPRPTIAPASRP